jgi:hypothetical protein
LASFPALTATAFVSLGGPGGSVSQFNASGGAALGSFCTPPGTTTLLLGNDGTKLFVGTTSTRQGDIQGGAPSVAAVLEAGTGAVLRQFALPGSVAQMVKNTAEDHLYASGTLADGTVVVMSVDLASGATASTAVPGAQAFDLYTIGITPNGARLFVPVTDSIAVFDSASLAMLGSVPLKGNGIAAPPLVTPDGSTLLTFGDGIVRAIDTTTLAMTKSLTITASAAAFGAALGGGVFAAGRLFVPEVSNVGVQENPSAPTAVKPIEVKFIITDSAAVVGNKVHANPGSQLKVINPHLERVARTMQVRVPSGGGIGSALAIAAAGDNSSMLANYVVQGGNMERGQQPLRQVGHAAGQPGLQRAGGACRRWHAPAGRCGPRQDRLPACGNAAVAVFSGGRTEAERHCRQPRRQQGGGDRRHVEHGDLRRPRDAHPAGQRQRRRALLGGGVPELTIQPSTGSVSAGRPAAGSVAAQPA